MIDLTPPPLILPIHYEAKRPAIIRLEADPARHTRPDQAVLPGMIPLIAGGGARLSYIGTNSSATFTSSFNLGNFIIPRDGLMIVGTTGKSVSGTGQVTSITIDGTVISAGSLIARTPLNNSRAAFATKVISAGSRGVSVVMSNNVDRIGVAVWLLENYLSTTPVATDIQSPSDGTSALNISSGAMTVNAGGFATYIQGRNGASIDNVWSAATERVDQNSGGTVSPYSAADWAQTGPTGTHVETVSWTPTQSSRILTSVSWR